MRGWSHRVPPTAATVALALVLGSASSADVYLYEASVPPIDAGWELIQNWCGAQEWIEEGELYHHVELCPPWANGQSISYLHPVEEGSSTGEWFAEWRIVTDGISEEIPSVAPASVVVSDASALIYHFTISDDTVRLIRDFDFPVLFFDVEPGVPHTYRLELCGEDLDETYFVYIDGQLLDSGVPVGPLFNPITGDAQVNFRSKAVLVPSTAIWSYFRWGQLQVYGGGDFTDDGEVNSDDLPFFRECLNTEAGGWPGCTWADMDFDSDTDCDDWALFVKAWSARDSASCSPTCGDCNPADFNHDGQVGPFDLATLLASWGPCPDCDACPPDLNNDCTVGPADLAMLLGSWG